MKVKIEISRDEHGHHWVRKSGEHHGSKTYESARRKAEEIFAELGAENAEIADRVRARQ